MYANYCLVQLWETECDENSVISRYCWTSIVVVVVVVLLVITTLTMLTKKASNVPISCWSLATASGGGTGFQCAAESIVTSSHGGAGPLVRLWAMPQMYWSTSRPSSNAGLLHTRHHITLWLGNAVVRTPDLRSAGRCCHIARQRPWAKSSDTHTCMPSAFEVTTVWRYRNVINLI